MWEKIGKKEVAIQEFMDKLGEFIAENIKQEG